MSSEVTNNAAANRYELHVDGELAGVIDYRRRPAGVALIHTEVFAAFQNRGLGAVLAKGALEDLRGRGESLIPICPYLVTYLKRHPEYADLVAAQD
jgi:predicted GNAT family acetyltransferase